MWVRCRAEVAEGGKREEGLPGIESALGPLAALPGGDPSDEARNYRLAGGGRGVVGFIGPVSQPYCGTCNRMRLTAYGRLHLCLLNDDEVDAGPRCSAAAVSRRWRRSCCAPSLTSRSAIGLAAGRFTEERQMFQIGG